MTHVLVTKDSLKNNNMQVLLGCVLQPTHGKREPERLFPREIHVCGDDAWNVGLRLTDLWPYKSTGSSTEIE